MFQPTAAQIDLNKYKQNTALNGCGGAVYAVGFKDVRRARASTTDPNSTAQQVDIDASEFTTNQATAGEPVAAAGWLARTHFCLCVCVCRQAAPFTRAT